MRDFGTVKRAAGSVRDVGVDGRVLRSERSRGAIVAAMMELVGEGTLAPTAEQIAERAGVALRTVFRHFRDLEGIFEAMDAALESSVMLELGRESPDGDLPQRIRALVQRRGRLFERIAPYKRSEALKRWQSDFLRGRHDSLVRRLRAEMRRWLPEFGECGEDVRAAVELALSFEAWDRLRSDQKLGPGRTLAAMERMAAALLGSPLAERTRQGGRAARVRRPGRR